MFILAQSVMARARRCSLAISPNFPRSLAAVPVQVPSTTTLWKLRFLSTQHEINHVRRNRAHLINTSGVEIEQGVPLVAAPVGVGKFWHAAYGWLQLICRNVLLSLI